MGWDKGSLTEQQIKGTGTTIQRRRIHKKNSEMFRATLTAQFPVHSQSRDCLPLGQLPLPQNPA